MEVWGVMAMIVGVGNDVVEIARIAQAIERHGDAFLRRVLSPMEHLSARDMEEARRHEFVAGRFAAKESIAKVSGLGLGRLGMSKVDIQLANNGLVVVFLHEDWQTRAKPALPSYSPPPQSSPSPQTALAPERAKLPTTELVWHLSISHTRQMAFAVAVLEQL